MDPSRPMSCVTTMVSAIQGRTSGRGSPNSNLKDSSFLLEAYRKYCHHRQIVAFYTEHYLLALKGSKLTFHSSFLKRNSSFLLEAYRKYCHHREIVAFYTEYYLPTLKSSKLAFHSSFLKKNTVITGRLWHFTQRIIY